MFEDLVVRPQGDKSCTSLADHDRLLQRVLSQTIQPPAGPLVSQGGTRPAREPHNLVARQHLNWQVNGCRNIPLDWSLKTNVRFTSSVPLSVVEQAISASTSSVAAGMRAFASASNSDEGLSMQVTGPWDLLQPRTHPSVFPPVPPSAARSLSPSLPRFLLSTALLPAVCRILHALFTNSICLSTSVVSCSFTSLCPLSQSFLSFAGISTHVFLKSLRRSRSSFLH